MGPSQPVQNAMMVSEFDGEMGEGEQGREGGRARSRAGFARVLKGREAGDEVGKRKGSCAGKPDVLAAGALGKTGREAREGGRAGAPQPSTRRGEANAGGAGPGGLLSAGGHGQVTIRRWEEADRAARKQIRGWLSPCSLCFPAKSHAPSCSILRLLAPSQHHPQHCRQIAAASVPPRGGIPHCAASPLASSRALGGRRSKAEPAMNSIVCALPCSHPKALPFVLGWAGFLPLAPQKWCWVLKAQLGGKAWEVSSSLQGNSAKKKHYRCVGDKTEKMLFVTATKRSPEQPQQQPGLRTGATGVTGDVTALPPGQVLVDC